MFEIQKFRVIPADKETLTDGLPEDFTPGEWSLSRTGEEANAYDYFKA